MHLRSKRISLLLPDSPDCRDVHHYVWVKNLPRLVTNRNEHRRHVCMSCLQAFTLQRVLEQHEPNCLAHAPQQCVYPYPSKATLSFNMHYCEFPFDFYLVADLNVFSVRPPTMTTSRTSKPFTFRPDFVSFASPTTSRILPNPSCIRAMM